MDELLALRAEEKAPGRRRTRLVTFGELFDAWMAAGCPRAAPSSRRRRAGSKSANTIENVQHLVDGHLRPEIGKLWVDRTTTERLEELFAAMADAGYATSTIDHVWGYLNQACLYGLRQRKVEHNPAAEAAQGVHD